MMRGGQKCRLTLMRRFETLWLEGISCGKIAEVLSIGRRTAQMWALELGYQPRPVGRPLKGSSGLPSVHQQADAAEG